MSVSEYRRSSFCGESTHVEVVLRPDGVRVRDGKSVGDRNCSSPPLSGRRFVTGVKPGKFDTFR
jgi:hypothetical protein